MYLEKIEQLFLETKTNVNDKRTKKRLKLIVDELANLIAITGTCELEPKFFEMSADEIDRRFGSTPMVRKLMSILLLKESWPLVVKPGRTQAFGKYEKNVASLNWCVNVQAWRDLKFFIERQKMTSKQASKFLSSIASSKFTDELSTGDFEYEEKNFRLYHPLQNYVKKIRSAVLVEHGYFYDYDITSAMPSILVQLFLARGGDASQIQTLIDYVANVKFVRSTLAEFHQTEEKNIKKLINSLFFGVAFFMGNDVLEDIFDTPEVLLSVVNDAYLYDFKNEIIVLRQFLTENFKEDFPDVKLQTFERKLKSGEVIQVDKWRSKLFYVYVQEERKVIDFVEQYVNEVCSDAKLFRIHDGFVSSKKVNLDLLKKKLKEQTGYDISFTEEKVVA
jgi:hypothetical protein